MSVDPKHERKIAWIALFLTTGEFVAGVFLVVHHGHVLALYVAITYLSREMTKSVHYHDIVVDLAKKAWKWRAK